MSPPFNLQLTLLLLVLFIVFVYFQGIESTAVVNVTSYYATKSNDERTRTGKYYLSIYSRSFNTTYLNYYYYLCYMCTGAVIIKAILSEMHRINYKNISRNKLHS